jgi:hypothetical protein
MSANLVSLVMQFLTPDMISRIAAALGLDRNNAQTAIGAAVPALLAGFTGASAKPGGAQNLVDAIRQQSGVLDGFANTISGSGRSSLLDQGATLLRSLLGSQDQSALAGAVSKFAGVDQNTGNSLLAMLAPLIMAVIGKQIGGRNLNADNLTDLLVSQKDQITQATPRGFDKLLAGTGILDSLSGVTGSAAAFAGQASRAAASATGQAAQYGTSAAYAVGGAGQRAAGVAGSGVPAWIYWAVPLVVAAGLIWYLLASHTDEVAQQLPQPTSPAIMLAGVDVGKELRDSVAVTRTTLQKITDIASAKAAVPVLRDASIQIEKVNTALNQLPEEQRKVLIGQAASATAALNPLVDKVLAIPGAGEVLKPVVDPLKTRLADLSARSTTIGGR